MYYLWGLFHKTACGYISKFYGIKTVLMLLLFLLLLLGVKEIDIAAALEHIRDQRPGLVCTKVPSVCVYAFACHSIKALSCYLWWISIITQLFPSVLYLSFSLPPFFFLCFLSTSLALAPSDQDQFEFALTAVAEEVNAILKALPQ